MEALIILEMEVFSMSNLDEFGKFLVSRLRDYGILECSWLQTGALRTPAIQALQGELTAMDEREKELLKRCVVRILDGCLHNILVGLQEAHDLGEGIEVFVNGENMAEVSGMLHGEIFGENGWIQRFSKYAPCKDMAGACVVTTEDTSQQ